MSSFDSITNIASIGLFFLTAALFLLFSMRPQKSFDETFRTILPLQNLRHAIFSAIETGNRLHISLGKSSIINSNAASALVGLKALTGLVKITSFCDRPPVATGGDSTLSILSRDTLRSAYRSINLMDTFDPTRGRLTGLTPLSYTAGLLPVIHDERVSAHILTGNFGAEVSLALEMIHKENAFVLAATDSLPAQAVMYASSPNTLIGEELFALPAFLQPDHFQISSLITQDTLRWLIIIFLIIGSALKIIGVDVL